jgi:hypothetical protein
MSELTGLEKIVEKLQPRTCMLSKATFGLVIDSINNFIIVRT